MALAVWLWTVLAMGQEPVEATPPDAGDPVADDRAEVRELIERLQAQEARLEEQEARLRDQQGRLAEQQVALEDLSAQLARARVKLLPDDLRVDMEGHFRLRGYLHNRLLTQQTDGETYRDARFARQRLWLRPVFRYRDVVSLHVEARALDDVVLGDNRVRSDAALFADPPSSTGVDGWERRGVELARIWTEVEVPGGLLKVGRQPAHWGMGLLTHDGERFDRPFGESLSRGAIHDRALFEGRPLSLLQGAAGRSGDTPFLTAVGVDRVVTRPLGPETCDDPACGELLEVGRGADWWASADPATVQMNYIVAYQGEGIDYLGGTGDLTAGAWMMHRRQGRSGGHLRITDLYFKSFVHSVLLEAQLVRVSGSSPEQVSTTGYVTRLGYLRRHWKALFEHGFASGPGGSGDGRITGRPLHPDHNVGLLLYREVLSRVTAQADATGGQWSGGGVYNSRYVFPTVHLTPGADWELLAGLVVAWPHQADGALIRCREGERSLDCAGWMGERATAGPLGWEVDVGIKHRMHERLLLSVEGGVARVTDRIPLQAAGLDPAGRFLTLQSRLAWVF